MSQLSSLTIYACVDFAGLSPTASMGTIYAGIGTRRRALVFQGSFDDLAEYVVPFIASGFCGYESFWFSKYVDHPPFYQHIIDD